MAIPGSNSGFDSYHVTSRNSEGKGPHLRSATCSSTLAWFVVISQLEFLMM